MLNLGESKAEIASLVESLSDRNTTVRQQAALALSNLALNAENQITIIALAGAIASLVGLLAALVLCNLAVNAENARNAIEIESDFRSPSPTGEECCERAVRSESLTSLGFFALQALGGQTVDTVEAQRRLEQAADTVEAQRPLEQAAAASHGEAQPRASSPR